MRRLPGPAGWPLGEGVKTPEAPVELFRGWQRTQTQSSVRTLRSLRQQMDVWFCLMQESSAERHCCVKADPDETNCAPSGARPGILCFSLDLDLHRCGPTGHNPIFKFCPNWRFPLLDPGQCSDHDSREQIQRETQQALNSAQTGLHGSSFESLPELYRVRWRSFGARRAERGWSGDGTFASARVH